MTDDAQPRATRDSWQILACPADRAALRLATTYTPLEFEQITRGLIPVEMEDKWFVFFEAPWLFLHRSWTGVCVYGVRFETSRDGGAAIAESWVSCDKDEYGGRDDLRHEERLLAFLIDALLLKKPVPYPS